MRVYDIDKACLSKEACLAKKACMDTGSPVSPPHPPPQVIVELIAACLSPDPRQRPSAEKTLQVLLLTDGW